MIRKPDASEFRESEAVRAVRDARVFAVEGAKGVRDGTASFVGRAMTGLFVVGFLISILGHIGPLVLLLGLAGAAAWFLKRRKRCNAHIAADWLPASLAECHMVGEYASAQRYELSVGAVGRRAAAVAIPAILFFPTSTLPYMLPFAVAGIVSLALAMLLVTRVFGDRTVVRWDAETLTVVGLLGDATILWVDVVDVTVRKAGFFALRTLFTSGTRRNVVVLSRWNRLGGPNTLYIPIDLLGIDQGALAKLITRLLTFRAGADPRPADHTAAPPPQSMIIASPPPPIPPRTFTTPLASENIFDPDAIIARYMANRDAAHQLGSPAVDVGLDVLRTCQHIDRQQTRAEVRHASPTPSRAAFGRKVAR